MKTSTAFPLLSLSRLKVTAITLAPSKSLMIFGRFCSATRCHTLAASGERRMPTLPWTFYLRFALGQHQGRYICTWIRDDFIRLLTRHAMSQRDRWRTPCATDPLCCVNELSESRIRLQSTAILRKYVQPIEFPRSWRLGCCCLQRGTSHSPRVCDSLRVGGGLERMPLGGAASE